MTEKLPSVIRAVDEVDMPKSRRRERPEAAMDHHEENTPIERPLLRSDLNDIRDIVHSISERQLAFLQKAEATEKRVSRLEQHIWLPALVSMVAAALAVLARVVP